MEEELTDQEVTLFLSENYNDTDLIGGIQTVAYLFSERAIPRLLDIIQSQGRSFEARREAACAIRDIGAELCLETLYKLQSQENSQLRELANQALEYIKRKACSR